MSKSTFKYLLHSLVIGLGIISSCSTEKDALLNVGYHNMTARYNGYYNAGVIIDEALFNFRDGYQEDYTQILPLDLYPNEEEVAGMVPALEDAIERCSKVVVRHSMPNPQTVKNKKNENCRWIDDNWLVIGQAYYIKRDYKEAKQKLKHVSESEMFRDEESIFEARIWLAKTHIALKEFSEAKRILTNVEQSVKRAEADQEKDKKKRPKSKYQRKKARKAAKEEKNSKAAEFPKKLKEDFELVYAELYIAQKEYKKAIEHLEKGIELCKKRKKRSRYQFVLAQLYEREGNLDKAGLLFDKVASSNAPYEMRFKAKIKTALAATGGTEDIVKELQKMLKDGKNLEYKDQIYYALAEIDVKKDDIPNAKINYTESVLWSISNDLQKGISYLALADIHFEERDYLSAQKYYDSCVQVLPKEHPDYEMLQNKALGLADLVFHYETVTFQDSVQTISRMSDKERQKFLEKTSKQLIAEREKKKIEAEQRLLQQQDRINQQQQQQQGNGQKGKGYFANPKQVASGFNDFRGLWGQRPLEDNWRRANKSSFEEIVDENGEAVDSLQQDEYDVELLLQDIPLTPEAIDSSNNKIMNSLYNLGMIYKEQLKEEKEAVVYFGEVVERNIEHEKVLPSLYQLYLINNKKGNGQANTYKSKILSDYPDSEIAQIIKDPEYLKKKELKDREELNAYSNVLRTYRRRSYGVVITACNEVITNEPDNQFLLKYYLLKAFSLSKITPGNVEAISEPLKTVYEKSPDSEEGIQAKTYLGLLEQGENIVEPDQDVAQPESPYEFKEEGKHFFIVAIPADKGNAGSAKISVSNFNSEFYRNDRLALQNAPLGNAITLIVVRSFESLEDAKKYRTAFQSNQAKKTLGKVSSDYQHAIISTTNFTTLFRLKDFAQYYDFYKLNY